MSESQNPPAGTGTDIPWWARPEGVVIVIGAYCALFLLVTGLLSSAFNPDDEKASYATQILALNYSSRNPPLYDWILYGVQHLAGVRPFTFALVRYTFLFAFGCAAYALARRAIVDARLQALSVFSISLLWQVGYHAHRINTHSDLMIVFIALTTLLFVELRERPTAGRYALLGALVALGTLSKFGYLAFLASAIAGALALASYRRVLFDRRIVIAVMVAALPLAAFFTIGTLEQQHYVGSVMRVVLPRDQTGMGATIVLLTIAWVGYVMPFLALFLLLVWPWREPAADRSGSRLDDARLFLRNLVIAATVISCGGVLVLENTNVRDRYFNAFYPLVTVYAFAEADRRRIDARRLSAFATTLTATAGGIAALLGAQRLTPDPRLCDQCNQSIPHVQFGHELRVRFGASPLLITPIDAGQLRINMPAARVVETAGRSRSPPYWPARPCVLVWNEYTGEPPWLDHLRRVAGEAGVRLQDAERITLPRFAPLRLTDWPMDFYVLRLPDDSPPCR